MARKQKPTFEQLQGDYTRLLGSYKETRRDALRRTATKLLGYSDRYKEVSELTGVPWEFIAVIHYRESNCNFETHLHNGDSLQKRTRRVPRGYPKKGTPPFTWVESAVDALLIKGLDKVTDWSPERVCYELERFNGLGYRMYHPHVLSPYLWSGTDLYQIGKYTSDGSYDGSVRDVQLGTIPLYKQLTNQTIVVPEVVSASRKLTVMTRVRNAVAGVTAGIAGLDYWDLITKAKQFATDNAGVLLLGGAASIWLLMTILKSWSIQDYKEGRYIPSKEDNE